MKQLFENHWLIPIRKRLSMTMVPNSLVTTSNFHSIVQALSLLTSVHILQHPTRSLRLPTKSLEKFFALYSSSITELTQRKLITFSMRPSPQLCKLFIAHLTPHLAITHLAHWYSNTTCFLTFRSLQILSCSLDNTKHRLTADSLRLTHAGLSMTMPSATKFITAILTATSWKQFTLVPMRSFVSIPTIQLLKLT